MVICESKRRGGPLPIKYGKTFRPMVAPPALNKKILSTRKVSSREKSNVCYFTPIA